MASMAKTYWIAVDGKAGVTGSYQIALSSPACP
jgi:hypothetical protein